MKRTLLWVVVLVSFLFVGGCFSKKDSSSQVFIGLVTDTAGVNDQSFNQSGWEGLQKVQKDRNVRVAYKESSQMSDYVPNLQSLKDAKADLIFGIGFRMGDAVLEAAQNNPDQKYAIIDYGYESTPPNLMGVVFRDEQSSFLAGFVAAKTSKTGKIGFIGGVDSSIIRGFQYGYKAGAITANPSIVVYESYANSFSDAALGKVMALNMHNNGADVIFHAAAGVGDGIIEVAKEKNFWVIGVDRDQSYMAPDNILTSVMKLVGNSVYQISLDFLDGKFEGGRSISYGLKEKGVGLAPNPEKHISLEILKEVSAYENLIIEEKIQVPRTEPEFKIFQADLASMTSVK